MYDYSLRDFGFMLGSQSKKRVNAYLAALARSVGRETAVLEIGCGIGYFAMVACRLGARHVYAVEMNNSAVEMARRLVAANGLKDRITFFEGNSREIELPEKVDLVFSDIRGTLPWLADHIPTIVDARTRHMKPDALLIPRLDEVWAAVVHAPAIFHEIVSVWDDAPDYGLDLGSLKEQAVHQKSKVRLSPNQLQTQPILVKTLDYKTVEEENLNVVLNWKIEKDTVAHGFCLWFCSELIEGVRLDNSPEKPSNPIYGQMYFPWPSPLNASKGDRIKLSLKAFRHNHRYDWQWETTLFDGNGERMDCFSQSTLQGKMGLWPSLKEALQQASKTINSETN